MGQGPDEMSTSPEETSQARGSQPPPLTRGSRPQRKPIPSHPQSTPVENPEVVVATTPLTTSSVAASGAQPAPAAGETEPATLREDIAQTRAEMSGTIDAIQERLDPQRVVGEAKDAAKEAVQGVVQETTGAVREATLGKAGQMAGDVTETARGASFTIMDTIRDNPVPAAMAAIGVGWLAMSARNRSPAGQSSRYQARGSSPVDLYLPPGSAGQTRSGAAEVVSKTQARVGDVADQARDTAEQVASGAQDLVSGAADTATQVASSAGRTAGGASASLLETVRQNPVPAALVGVGIAWLLRNRDASSASGPYQSAMSSSPGAGLGATVGDLASRAKDQAGALRDQAQTQAQQAQGQLQRVLNDSPLAVGAVALGLGAAVGLAVPRTRQESQLMGEARDRLVDTAQTVVQETQQKVQHVAEEAQSAAKQEAQRQNLTQ
jgi:ElaB/YqjD/DUF883 family membrane-anchored ribosome-binding protein